MTILRKLGYQFQDYWLMGRSTLFRCFSQQVESVQGVGEVLRLENDDPHVKMVVIQPEERAWGPVHKLPQSIAQGLKLTPDDTVGILRPAFAAHDSPKRPLNQIMQDIGGGKVAFSSHLYKNRMIMDVYVQEEGEEGHKVEDIAVDPADLLDTFEFDLCHVVNFQNSSKSNAIKGLQRGVRLVVNPAAKEAPLLFWWQF
eukprot:TRINITY_DN47327_c0_g1_i1.p1 TRINITY_DN47327_c0_g1~~TRINITY_DN47327_c0_g1_i1.p1  ORF type:complete len:206 (-),score=27.46 TRINITY_DN47327_c0_g1_i1:46-642(-)